MHSEEGVLERKHIGTPGMSNFNSGFLFNYNKDTENYTNYKCTAQNFHKLTHPSSQHSSQ